MKRTKNSTIRVGAFPSGDSLGGKVHQYRDKQTIYKQGDPASTFFYIQSGGVRLTNRTKNKISAVTAIWGAGDLFGEICLAGYPVRMSTAISLTASMIRTVQKKEMLLLLHAKNNKAANVLVTYLLSTVQKYKDHVSDLLTSTAEQRLARVLLLLSHLDENGSAVAEIPFLSHQVLAEMVGTTRPRINLFMNRFRKQGFINYDGGLEVHQSLRKMLQAN